MIPSLTRLKQELCRLRLKCDGTRAETRFRLSTKRTSPFKSAVASVQSTTSSRGVRICGSNAGYTMFRGSVKSLFILLRTAALRLTVRSWLDVPTFAITRVTTREHPAAEGGTVGEKCPGILPKCRLQRYI